MGFEVRNASGKIQISDTDKVVAFNSKEFIYDDNKYHSNKLFALRGSHRNSILNRRTSLFAEHTNKTMGTGYIYKFDYEPRIHNTNYGLEVFSANGELTYSSNQRPLNVLERVYIADIRDTATTHNDNRTYFYKNYGNREVAVVFVRVPVYTRDRKVENTCAVYNNYNELSIIEGVSLRDREVAKRLISEHTLEFLVVDVTGY